MPACRPPSHYDVIAAWFTALLTTSHPPPPPELAKNLLLLRNIWDAHAWLSVIYYRASTWYLQHLTDKGSHFGLFSNIPRILIPVSRNTFLSLGNRSNRWLINGVLVFPSVSSCRSRQLETSGNRYRWVISNQGNNRACREEGERCSDARLAWLASPGSG